MKGRQISQNYKKKIKNWTRKLNRKLVFLLRVRINVKIQNEQYYACENVRPLVNTSLFTLKFYAKLSKELHILIKRPFWFRVILKELEQTSNFSVNSEVLTRGQTPSHT